MSGRDSNKTGAAYAGRGSVDLTIPPRTPFFHTAVIVVFLSIAVSAGWVPSYVPLIVLAILAVLGGVIAIQARNPAFLPRVMARLAVHVIDNIKASPYEWLLVVGIIYLCIDDFVPALRGLNPAWNTLIHCTLLWLAYQLSAIRLSAAQSGVQLPWYRRISQLFDKHAPPVRHGAVFTGDEGAAMLRASTVKEEPLENEESRIWRCAQQERWHGWIAEEMHRLDGKTCVDEHE